MGRRGGPSPPRRRRGARVRADVGDVRALQRGDEEPERDLPGRLDPADRDRDVVARGERLVQPGAAQLDDGHESAVGQPDHRLLGRVRTGGTGGSASCGSYGAFSTPASSPVNVTGNDISQWWCFRIHATSATVWTSQTVAFTPQRLFVPINTVVLTNGGGTAGSIEQGDTIQITFNQAPSNPGTITVSTDSAAGTVTIGNVGTISGLTVGANKSYDVSTSSVSGSQLTITLGASNNGNAHKPTTVGGLPGTFTGGSFTSSGGQNVCTAAACNDSTSGSF